MVHKTDKKKRGKKSNAGDKRKSANNQRKRIIYASFMLLDRVARC